MSKPRLTPFERQETHALAHPKDEHSQQVALFMWMATVLDKWPSLKWAYAIPNGGQRTKAEALRLVMEGVKAGVSDICLPISNSDYSGLYIEMKGMKGKVSEKQSEFLQHVLSQGFDAVVCYSYREARKVIEMYMEDTQ